MVIVILILIIVVYFFLTYLSLHVQFLSKKELIDFYKSDPDSYFANLNQLNLKRYDCVTGDQLMEKAIAFSDSFTLREKIRLQWICRRVDRFFKSFNKVPFFPSNKVADIKWRLAKQRGRGNEGGYFHTRCDIIFIPEGLFEDSSDDELYGTLIHEKIHIFSRLFPEDMSVWNKNNGFIRYKKVSEYPLHIFNVDSDEYVYKDRDGREMLGQFLDPYDVSERNSMYPNGICALKQGRDRMKCLSSEHPNEYLAYLVGSIL